MKLKAINIMLWAIGVLVVLQSCNGILSGIYDEPQADDDKQTIAGELYLNASDWKKWYYIDLPELNRMVLENPDFNTSSAWQEFDVPTEKLENSEGKSGIYTYWYDVWGEGIGKFEFRSFRPTARQPEPENWSFAVHRNNVRTNNGAVAATSYKTLEELPEGTDFLSALNFEKDIWNETDVWIIQDEMLSGLIGNQGIFVSKTLSSWLRVDLPPIPPAFTLDSCVFILRLEDGTYAALRLTNYQSSSGLKCCLSIQYKYPL